MTPNAQSRLATALAEPVIPAINGLRAIAILMLVVGHYGRRLGPVGYGLTQPLAGYSIVLLFVITGFIATIAMQRAFESPDPIRVRTWVLRKAMRLYPTLIAILVATTAIQSWKNGLPVPPARYAGFLSLLGNYYYSLADADTYRHALGHLWSIMVGAQFLIAWVIVFRWAILRSSTRHLAAPLAVVVASSMFLRVLLASISSLPPSYAYLATEARIGEIAIGALAALWATRRGPAPAWVSSGRLAMFAFALLIGGFFVDHWLRFSVQLVATVYLTVYLVGLNGSGLGRFLENRFLAGISLISYSVFTWHLFGLDLEGPLAFLPAAIRMPFVLVGTLVVGAVMYLILEWPVRRRTDTGVRGALAG